MDAPAKARVTGMQRPRVLRFVRKRAEHAEPDCRPKAAEDAGKKAAKKQPFPVVHHVRQLADTAFFQGLKQGFNPLIIFHIPFFLHMLQTQLTRCRYAYFMRTAAVLHTAQRPGSKLPGLCSVVWFYFIMLPLVFMLFSA